MIGHSSLHLSVFQNDFGTGKLLVNWGSDPYLADLAGKSPMDYAGGRLGLGSNSSGSGTREPRQGRGAQGAPPAAWEQPYHDPTRGTDTIQTQGAQSQFYSQGGRGGSSSRSRSGSPGSVAALATDVYEEAYAERLHLQHRNREISTQWAPGSQQAQHTQAV